MRFARITILFALALSMLPLGETQTRKVARESDSDEGKLVIYRDEYGVPHLFAPTGEAGLYGMGYAQAEDRLEELLKNYLRATGEMAAAFGPSELPGDLQARLFQHYAVAKRNYDRIRPEVRKHLAAFIRGINDYMAGHKEEVPIWWGDRKTDVYMAVAHSRQFMWGWPAGQAISEMQRAGVTPNFAADMRSSNEMAVAASRTSVQAPILIIDPHLSWWGAQRFWEFRIHAAEFRGSGFTIPGSPYVGLGHNEDVAWAMTTGGPDTADIYALELNPADATQYRYDGAWRTFASRKESIQVKGESRPRELTIYESHHGPVVARQEKRAYAAKLAYADEVQFGEAFYLFNIAKNVADFRKGLDLNQLMPQNVMVADTSGNIYYQRSGRVPVRPAGFDFSRPVDGTTSKSEWQGIHPSGDLISIENPPQGYMQNCNISPDVMMVNSPMTPDKYPAYLFNQPGGRISQRAARAVQLLEGDSRITPEKAMAIALDDHCLQSERWLTALKEADEKQGASRKDDADYQAGLRDLSNWDGNSRSDSRGALKFYYWRRAVRAAAGAGYVNLVTNLADYMAVLKRPDPRTWSSTETDQQTLTSSLAGAMNGMRKDLGTLDLTYGDIFRVGRDDKSWPVSGGSLMEEGMETLRAIGFDPPGKDQKRWGSRGQTSTQVVIMTRPVQSWTQPPIGQSDKPQSPFYRDQAEKLFSKSKMKPTWYLKSQLLQHVHSRTELKYPGASAP